jgi:hypothetical protein
MEREMSKACRTHGRGKKCLQKFSGNLNLEDLDVDGRISF